MTLGTLITDYPKQLNWASLSFDVKFVDGTSEFKLANVVLMDNIPVSPEHQNVRCNVDSFQHLRGVTLPHIDQASVTLLISNDHYLAQFPLKTRVAQDPKIDLMQSKRPLNGY